MGKSLHLEWNQLQLKIAKLLGEKKVAWEVAKELGCTKQSVYNVKKHIKKGDKPPSLDDAYIAAAPLPMIIGKTKPEPKKTDALTPAPTKQQPPPTHPVKNAPAVYTSAIQFAAQLQPIPLTPDIFVSYMVAVMNGYEGELVDWLSLVSRDFWFGRNRNMYQEYAGYTPPGKDHEGEVKYTGSLKESGTGGLNFNCIARFRMLLGHIPMNWGQSCSRH